MEEEDLDSLTTDFNKLRSSIATQLRQVQPIDKVVEKPKKAFAETLTADLPAPPLPPAPPATVNSPPKPTPLIAMEPDDDEVPTFYALRDSLHGKVSTSEGALPPPPKSYTLSLAIRQTRERVASRMWGHAWRHGSVAQSATSRSAPSHISLYATAAASSCWPTAVVASTSIRLAKIAPSRSTYATTTTHLTLWHLLGALRHARRSS